MNTETILWVRADEALPDSDMTVLAINHDDDVVQAWIEGDGGWHDCASGAPIAVTWWAEVKGPQ